MRPVCLSSGRQRMDLGRCARIYSSAEKGLASAASCRSTLSFVRTAWRSTDSGRSAAVTLAFRRLTETLPLPVVASASIQNSSRRARTSRPRSAPAYSVAARMSASISSSETISPRADWETLSQSASRLLSRPASEEGGELISTILLLLFYEQLYAQRQNIEMEVSLDVSRAREEQFLYARGHE